MRGALSLSAFLLALMPLAIQAEGLPTVTEADAKGWQVPVGLTVSKSGKWSAVTIRKLDDDGQLVFTNLADGRRYEAPRGMDPVFSPNEEIAAYRILPPVSRIIALKESGKPIPMDLGLMSLKDGRVQTLPDVGTFSFIGGARLEALAGNRTFYLHDFDGGASAKVEDVSSAVPSPDRSKIALSVGSSDTRWLMLLDAKTGRIRPLATGTDSYSQLAWSKDGEALAYLSGRTVAGMDAMANRLCVATRLNAKPVIDVFDPATRRDFPAASRIVETSPLSLNDDGSVVAFGIGSWQKVAAPTETTVEVWNSKDRVTVPERRTAQAKGSSQTMLAVWRRDEDRIIRLEDHPIQEVTILPGFDTALLTDRLPYLDPADRNYVYWDVKTIDLKTGESKTVFAKCDNLPIVSKSGRLFAVFDKLNWWVYDRRTGTKTDVTGDLKVTFANEDWNFAKGSEMAMADPEWTDDDGLIVYDRYDAWVWHLGATARKLTDGRPSRRRFRRISASSAIDLSRPVLFETLVDESKKAGVWRMEPSGHGSMVLPEEAVVRRFFAASNDGRRVVYSQASYDRSPIFYATDDRFDKQTAILRTNPQQSRFAWGKVELIDYKTPSGTPLHATLVYPADYDPSKRYPMVANVYERASDDAWQYLAPSYQAYYNPQVFSQNGYFVLLPDLAFEKPRQPGQSALESMNAALDAVFSRNLPIDPSKVGVMGHSWGAYEAAYLSTVSDRFAAAVCGSGLYDFASMAGGQYWTNGIPASVVVEVGQGRMEVPIWDDPKAYIESSVVWQAPKRTAPILIEVGDQDDVVDWSQGLQLYNALRRLGKPAILLNYRGDGHFLQKRANQIDYSHRLRHFFDVVLKGVPPEPWIAKPYP